MTIRRSGTGQRMSQAVIANGTVYLSGQVGTAGTDIAGQTRDCLGAIDALLAEAGTSRSHLLQVTIWLSDMRDFDAMNAVYDDWIDPHAPPARACGESRLASSDYLVEIIAVAALP